MRVLGVSSGLSAVSLVVCVVSCGSPREPASEPETVYGTVLGAPLQGLSAAELARFEAGKAAFSHVFTPEEGLGPVYNESSCNACHSHPGIGGTGGEEYDIHATRTAPDGSCDLLDAQGGENVRNRVTPAAAAAGLAAEHTPVEATERGLFTAPAMWGRGLVEAIPDEAIEAREDPDGADGDGITGRVGRDASGRVGRFRRKADVADLADIAEGGVLVELGLTTPKHPSETVFSSASIPAGADPAPDPELDQRTIDAIADFIRFLAPPPRNMPTDPAERTQVAVGERLFTEVGCAKCHVPSMVTGPNPVKALDHKRVFLHSDLLLHDMGRELADVCSPAAAPSEFRTEILMGLSYRTVYMHDGRAPTLWEAIALHGGESARSRDAFDALPELERHALVAYLGTL
jgi:CxxC motif-containing protein (DUF1111 family)